MATELGQAYVQIMPSAKGIQGSITKQLAPEARSAGTSAGSLIGGGLVKSLTGIIAAAGIGKMVGDAIKSSINEGANLQQSLGGSEAVFGGFAKNIQKTAGDAYKNMGLSASAYMETANKMGSLFQGSGISQVKSVALTTKAMQRASDVASVMGVDTSMAMESIAGAAKGNFEMMDNLGVAMNASTLQAYALEKGVNFKWDTASNAEKAQLAMKMFMDKTSKYAGNFQKEASSTYSGSLDSMKASYKNFIGSLSLGENILPSFVKMSKSISTFVFGNFFPMMGNMFTGIGTLIGDSLGKALPTLKDKISTGLATLTENMPEFLNTGVKMLTDLANGFMQALPQIWTAFGQITSSLAQFLMDNGPLILQAGGKLLLNIIDGIIQNLPAIATAATQAVLSFIGTITSNFPKYISTGYEILGKLIAGIVQRLPQLIDTALKAMGTFIQGLLSKLPEIGQAGLKTMGSLAGGLLGAIGQIISATGKIANTIIKSVTGIDLASAGRAIIQGFIDGMVATWEAGKNFVSGIAGWIKDHKGPISYDKTLLIPAGNAIMDGLNKGLIDNFKTVKLTVSSMADQLSDAFGSPQLAYEFDGGPLSSLSNNIQASNSNLTNQLKSSSTYDDVSNSQLLGAIRSISSRPIVVSNQVNGVEFSRLTAKDMNNEINRQETVLRHMRGEL